MHLSQSSGIFREQRSTLTFLTLLDWNGSVETKAIMGSTIGVSVATPYTTLARSGFCPPPPSQTLTANKRPRRGTTMPFLE